MTDTKSLVQRLRAMGHTDAHRAAQMIEALEARVAELEDEARELVHQVQLSESAAMDAMGENG